MMTVPDIFEQLGGVSAIAAETGIPLTTVHSWKRAGFVPHWRIDVLVALASKLGKDLPADCVPTRGAASAPDAVRGQAAA
ncbi:carph-isopro domain-containing protein [Sphingomonas dokdonensis]|uniref:carph-isopro domain-containing protein n=1 Tax=Sphingomonas dokdonensis TaxID=344880 RepID=UPI001303DBB4|nr:hypothetical protein [Sphingomonas dokdonensis]